MPRIMPWKSVSTAWRSRNESDEQPKASTTHSIPLMRVSPLRLGLSTFRAEFAGTRDGLATLTAEFCVGSCCGGARGSGSCATASWRRRSGLLDGVHHRLAHGNARAKPSAHADGSATFIPGGNWNGLRDL